MGISGAKFKEAYSTNGNLIFAACDHVFTKWWIVMFVKDVIPGGVLCIGW